MTKQQMIEAINDLKESLDYKTDELKELKESIEELENQIKTVEEPIKPKRWKPIHHEIYFLVNDSGKIEQEYYDNVNSDNYRILQRNCFKTENEAEQYLKWLTIDAQIRDIAEELNGEDVIDWSDSDQRKFYIIYDFIDKDFCCLDTFNITSGESHCLSNELLSVCIDRISESDLKFYFTYER
jgi:hypothetical protein